MLIIDSLKLYAGSKMKKILTVRKTNKHFLEEKSLNRPKSCKGTKLLNLDSNGKRRKKHIKHNRSLNSHHTSNHQVVQLTTKQWTIPKLTCIILQSQCLLHPTICRRPPQIVRTDKTAERRKRVYKEKQERSSIKRIHQKEVALQWRKLHGSENTSFTSRSRKKKQEYTTKSASRQARKTAMCNFISYFRGLKPGTLVQMEMNKRLRGE